jgi:hypothetical protein
MKIKHDLVQSLLQRLQQAVAANKVAASKQASASKA